MMTLMVLQQQDLELKPIFRHMLSLLLVSDSSCILLTNIMFSLPVVSTRYALFTYPHLIPVLLPITQIFLTISVYTTIGVAVERFVSISTHTPQHRVRIFLSIERFFIHQIRMYHSFKMFQIYKLADVDIQNIVYFFLCLPLEP